MLKVKSFKISDDVGINELLENYRLAEGAHILVSDGMVCIPYEDGSAPTAQQVRIETLEQINKLHRQVAPMEHSQIVLGRLSEELRAKLETATADFKSEPNNKKFEAKKKELEEALAHNESQIRHNEHEIRRIMVNVEVFQGTLK